MNPAARRLEGGTATISRIPALRPMSSGRNPATLSAASRARTPSSPCCYRRSRRLPPTWRGLRLTRGAGGRRREALQLVAYKLEQLRFHLTTSRRRLNDLRNLRHIVEGELSMDRERREGLERCA